MNPELTTDTPPVKIFAAKRAAIIFGANILVQFLVGFLMGMVFGIYHGYQNAAHHLHLDPKEVAALVQKEIVLPTAVCGIIAGTWVVYRMVRRNFPGSIREGAFEALGGVRSTPREILLAALVGVVLVLINLFLIHRLFPPDGHNYIGPMAAASGASTIGKYFWILIVVLMAPPSEEFIFRGVLYTGFSRSWGRLPAAALVSVLFVSLHLVEVWGYLPALFGISGLAVATMIARLKTGSLIAPMTLHIAYNLTLATIVFGFSPTL